MWWFSQNQSNIDTIVMGKGKKKANKGKNRSGGKKEKVREDTGVGGSSHNITPELEERARLAAENRTEDPLKNWTRLQNEECPICMLPLPFRESDTIYCVTCGKTVCWGCVVSAGIVHKKDGVDVNKAFEKAMTCPYCRSNPASYDDKAALKALMRLTEAGEHEAMYRVGGYYFEGKMGLRQDKEEGLKWFHRAVEAGSGKAACDIGSFYYIGDGVDKDEDKALEYYQKAAELGNIPSFYALGNVLLERGKFEEGMLYLRKAAMCGLIYDSLFNILRNGFKCGYITKDEYAFTLREHQKACNEMKSDGREEWILAQENR